MEETLTVFFRGTPIPVTYPSLSRELAEKAVESEPFTTWLDRCSTPANNGKQLQLEAIELQSVDMFGKRVGFVKLKSVCKLRDGDVLHDQALPGICFLRGNGVSILVALCCEEDGTTYSLLVDQPRVPIGQASTLELPAGMLDGDGGVAGIAVQEIKEECGIEVKESELIDLTELACQDALDGGHIPFAGVCPSPGGCDEFIRFMYLEKRVSKMELEAMKGRLSGLRHHGEIITLRVVPLEVVWKVSADAKAMCSLFLLRELRKEGKLPPLGGLATPLSVEPTLSMNTGKGIPQLAFGLYKIPGTDEGERIILDAISAGYRHFDTASFYENEAALGRALKKSGLPRESFFITSKVWNDAQTKGRAAVRESVEESLEMLDFGGYFDLFLIHWPVPGHFVETYKELEILHGEGKLHNLGLSNFSPEEYKELVNSGIHVTPVVNQLEVSPLLCQKDVIDFFEGHNILISAYKPLNRAACFDMCPIPELAAKYSKTPAQIMLRWGLQKGLIVVAKTRSRMKENRDITDFSLTNEEMLLLDALTTTEYIEDRDKNKFNFMRKTSK